MKTRRSVIPVTLCMLCLVGCASTNLVPYTFAEKYAYDEGYLEDPKVTCELGYQKVYYVLNNRSEDTGSAVLTMTNCLTADHVEKLKVLATAPDQYSSDASSIASREAKTQVAEIIKELRPPLPDPSVQ